MKKYWEAARATFKTRAVYRFDTAMQVFASLARVLFAWLLWGAIFEGRGMVAGFTLDTMLLYYLLQSLFTQLDNTGRIAEELSGHIRDGAYSKFLVLPVRVQGYLFSQSLGSAAYSLFFSLAAGAFCLLAFPFRPAVSGAWPDYVQALALLLLGRVFLTQLHFYLGILTFRFQDIWIFLMIKSNLMAFLTGALVPLSLLPVGILAVLRLTPFYYTGYLPAMLLLGRGGGEGASGALTLCAWIALFFFLNKQAYAHLRARYDGVGI